MLGVTNVIKEVSRFKKSKWYLVIKRRKLTYLSFFFIIKIVGCGRYER